MHTMPTQQMGGIPSGRDYILFRFAHEILISLRALHALMKFLISCRKPP